MRWNVPKRPEIGDRRAVKSFAFLPTLVSGLVVWLEPYWKMQEYKQGGWDEETGWKTVYLGLIEQDTYLWRSKA